MPRDRRQPFLRMRGIRTSVAACILALVSGAAQAEAFRFVALGDMPYGKPKKVYPAYEALIGAINDTLPDLVIHVGDTKSGGTKCSDKTLDAQRGYLDSFDAPTLYTPGDNEWTDCHRKKAGKFDPLERLAYIRKTYFGQPSRSFGARAVALDHQGDAGYPENASLMHENVLFATIHVVGSNNNLDPSKNAAAKEHYARNLAALDWMARAFADAANAEALVLAYHADIFREIERTDDTTWKKNSGFRDFGIALRKHAAAYGKPVLLIFGDSHTYRVFEPFPDAPNLTALEVFGAEDMHAVDVSYDPDGGAAPFSIAPLLNPGL